MAFPVDEVADDLQAGIVAGEAVLLRAPTGSGKSTRVPGMVADVCGEGMIVVVQPRRMAARLLAKYVAQQRGATLGQEVGYVVRHDSKYRRDTRIVFVTDGVLMRWLTESPDLPRVAAVVFDEFHERRVSSDMALGLCMALKRDARADLSLIVMSATLEVEGLESYLAPCRVVEALGRSFPVEIEHRAAERVVSRGGGGRPQAMWERVVAAVKSELKSADGHLLVFVPGAFEIRKVCDTVAAAGWSSGWEVVPLHGGLSPAEQDRAVRSGGPPRVIVSTNVAETSLTIEGVTVVIDSGQARQAVFDQRRGFDSLLIGEISQASAQQRAGRAGRVQPGRCVRLWSEANHRKRLAFDPPEVRRVDLAEAVLTLAGREFEWLTEPTIEAVDRATSLLELLGALDESGGLTGAGQLMRDLPLHPRLARLILAAAGEECVAEACFAAAVLQGEGVFQTGKEGRADCATEADTDDFAAEWVAYEAAKRARYDLATCKRVGVLARGARETDKAFLQLLGVCKAAGFPVGEVRFTRNAEGFGRAMLLAYADRLAVRLSASTLSCRVAGRGRGKLAADSAARNANVFVATEMAEVGGREVTTHLNRCVAVEREWLEEFFPGQLRSSSGGSYDESRRRVVNCERVVFGDLVLSEKEGGEPDRGVAAELLAQRVVSGELVLKKWDDAVEQWIARLVCLSEWMPELEMPSFNDEDRQVAIEQLCDGAVSYKEIKDRDPWPVLGEWLNAAQKAALESFAPSRMTLVNGTNVKVRYAIGQPPVVAQRVQQLFGVEETPTVANGAVKIMMHICAPNQRPWQMTTDMPGFWKTGLEQMRKDLAGRYPKHRWEV